MKKLFCLILGYLFFWSASAQDTAFQPKITVKWAPTGLFLGDLSLNGEYSFLKNSSLTARIGIPLKRPYHGNFDNNDLNIKMKAFSFMAGFRKYLSKKMLKGFYAEPFFNFVHQTSDGIGEARLDNQDVIMDFTNDYNGFGIGVQLGTQFIIRKRYVIDLFFFGPQISASTNHFKAVDISNNPLGWNNIQAGEAEQDIRDFLYDLPVVGGFFKNKTDVMVDKYNRSVRTDFKGALPGIRIGFSIGIAL